MATALQAQLAQIASRSTNPLDLKAQRKAYSKSLLYEPKVAAEQDLDTLYDLCVEGYRELCDIDPRFEPFGRTLFSEQSKREDRSQLSGAQNEELDAVLESFMGLLEARLLLRPAGKALEWLIRHFRVHEMNSSYLLCIFLPYHSQPIFSTLLSILPGKLPAEFQFLAPCIERLRGPSRHEVVYAAARHSEFFRLWSYHVLSQCRHGYDFHEMTAYWASVITEATLIRIEQASRGNRASQQQKEESVLLDTLPILNDGLDMHNSPELRIGCQMVLTVLASKMDLAENVLESMMEAAISHRSQDTKDAELICLTVLSQKRTSSKLPRKVYNALRSLVALEEDLTVLREDYDVSNLTFGMLKAMLRSLKKDKSSFEPDFFIAAVERGLLNQAQSTKVVIELMSMASLGRTNLNYVTQSFTGLSKTQTGRRALLAALEGLEIDLAVFDADLQTLLRPKQLEEAMDWEPNGAEGAQAADSDAQFSDFKNLLPNSNPSVSFLEVQSTGFDAYYQTLRATGGSQELLSEFCSIPLLRKDQLFSKPTFLSFFYRVWCGPYPSETRMSAIRCVREAVRDSKTLGLVETQTLVPYTLFALADASDGVRMAAIELVVSVREKFEAHASKDAKSPASPFGGLDICGNEADLNDTSWLSSQNLRILLDLLGSHLEECRSDASYLTRVFHDILAKKYSGSTNKDLKSSQKDALLSFIADQVLRVPLYAVRTRLLMILSNAGVTTHNVKGRHLLDLIGAYRGMSDEELQAHARDEGLEATEVVAGALSVVSAADREGLKVIQELIKDATQKKILTLQRAALEQLAFLWPSIKPDWQGSFALTLLEGATKDRTEDAAIDSDTKSLDVLQQVSLHSAVLEKLLTSIPPLFTSLPDQTSPVSKRRKTNTGAPNGTGSQTTVKNFSDTMTRVTIVLELVEASKEGSDPHLIDPLFALLADLHHIKETDPRIDYAQILLLRLMTPVVERAKKEGLKVDRTSVRADLIVDYFRNASNAQLQQASLLLMAALASFVPEQVIHSIMPIFTFMGSTILRLSDDYSAHIIDKTIRSIIPPLIASLRKDKRGPLAGAAELLLSFVAAFDHIPLQRRQDLFIVLVDKLGPDEFLYALIVMLLDKHDNNDKVRRFALDLLAHYNPQIQMKATEEYLAIVVDSFKPKPTKAKHILSLEQHGDYAETALAISGFPVQFWRGSELLSSVSKLLKKQDEGSNAIRSSFARVLQLVLQLQELSLTHRQLAPVSDSLLDAALGILPLDEAIKSLEGLLSDGDDKTRRNVLHSLESRIAKQANKSRSRAACLGLLTPLHSILTTTTDALLKLRCISCIDRVAEIFGKSDPTAIASIASDITSGNGLASTNEQVSIRALWCLTTIVEVLEDAMIPEVPSAAPLCLSILEGEAAKSKVDAHVLQAGYSFFSALLLYVPYIVTGEYLDRLLNVSFQLAGRHVDAGFLQMQVDCLALVPRQINPHECFASLTRTWESISAKSFSDTHEATRMHLSLLDAAVERLTKPETVRHSTPIINLCLAVLDLRRLETGGLTDEHANLMESEQAIYDTLTKMIYKLNDAHFRPLFSRILNWAHDRSLGEASGDRQKLARSASVYGFVAHFFGTLKSIVTSYSALIADDAAELLQAGDPDGERGETDSFESLLWSRIIQSLSAAFEYDQDEFWQSPARFNGILPPLISQLQLVAPEAASTALTACITHLARAADSSDNLEAINTAVLLRMRSQRPHVRLNAVRCQQSLTDGLGEDWLALLPKMLPFISEAMEDDDEEVENATRAWVRRIEEVLGESMDAMLQ